MTPNIERMAREAASAVGIGWDEDGQIWESTRTQLERFAALVRAQALEEAAGLCEERRDRDLSNNHTSHAAAADDCARMIRRALKG